MGVFTRSALIILNGKISDKNKIVNLCIDDQRLAAVLLTVYCTAALISLSETLST